MYCKHCMTPSFLGEWNTPKETQNIKSGQKTCEACGEVVDIDTLVQQREERRGGMILCTCILLEWLGGVKWLVKGLGKAVLIKKNSNNINFIGRIFLL